MAADSHYATGEIVSAKCSQSRQVIMVEVIMVIMVMVVVKDKIY